MHAKIPKLPYSYFIFRHLVRTTGEIEKGRLFNFYERSRCRPAAGAAAADFLLRLCSIFDCSPAAGGAVAAGIWFAGDWARRRPRRLTHASDALRPPFGRT